MPGQAGQLHGDELYADTMLRFREWCRRQGIEMKPAVIGALEAYMAGRRIGGGSPPKPVEVIDVEHARVASFPSQSAAARALGVSERAVRVSIKEGWRLKGRKVRDAVNQEDKDVPVPTA